ncbi:hypothetical protein [Bacillus sp. B15-48]|uniref:hypothetical protein n=1 Tax=Bacillus sp. B15-48 TaxID=1548601 RepID=UPI00193F5E3D|nr:hypothetical protein [Bacillus sp. B15-48]MBM4763467.1 hypothetical protein [Bacillus sp. B15-48]
MNKKWLIMLTSMMLSFLLITGCGTNEDPSPPVDENQEQVPTGEEAPMDENETSDEPLDETDDTREDENMEGEHPELEQDDEEEQNR